MDRRTIELRIARSENLPVLPEVCSAMIKIIDLPNTSTQQLEQLIKSDVGITAKILKVVNSPMYGFSNIDSVSRAVGFLGLTAVRSLILSVAYQQMVHARPETPSFSMAMFWRHSLAVASAAKLIGKLIMPAKCNELYDAGMMHDVGLLVLLRFCPQELDHAVLASCDEGIPLHLSEERMYGYNHADIGGVLADKWGLHGMFKSAIQYHHKPLTANEFLRTTCIVAMADLIAHQCGYTNNVSNITSSVDPELLKVLNLEEEQFESIAAGLAGEVEKAEVAFGIAA